MKENKLLQDLNKLVLELNTTNSSNKKKEILAKYPQCKELLKWVYSYKTKFNVTSKNLKKRKDLKDNKKYKDIIELLKALDNRDITGHAAISAVNGFIEENKEYEDLIYKIIDKNLKTRTDTSLINKVWPNLIPTFDVQLASDYEKQKHKIDFEKDIWLSSHKLDGVRLITICDENGKPTCWSREGKEFTTLDKIKNEIIKLPLEKRVNRVFDGEICIVDENGVEHYKSIMNVIKKKDFTIPNPRYILFDYLTIEEFKSKVGNKIFSERYKELKELEFDPNFITILEQIKIKDLNHFEKLRDEASDKGWEGLIIRKDVIYEGKRSNNLLKVKKFYDAEYKVVSVENGPFRIIDKEMGWNVITTKIDNDDPNKFTITFDNVIEADSLPSGESKDIYLVDGIYYSYGRLEKEEEMLARVNILHKGNIVGVGSGFSIEQRQYYYKHPEEIIGKTITVKYFEETEDKNGKKSLRFPIVKYIYEDERDV